ncbi:MAG: xanthine dehydrogenase family protein molybdopterin-binding subunit [Actinomycetota bacterium]|nr:xanthine dehydrogenase family protein molybdopterin-binding subunit [Actinomycetota bacterium]
MAGLIGQAVRRREDAALLRGERRYVADLVVEGCCELTFVRSPLAHARIRRVDVAAATAQPGVVAVWTAEELGLADLQEAPPPPSGPRPALARPLLARDTVRFVGEPVALVVATSRAEAVDAAELVVVEYDPLPAVVDPLGALEDGTLLFPAHGTNLVRDDRTTGTTGTTGTTTGGMPAGDDPLPGGEDEALAGAEVVVRARFWNQRVAPAPLETAGVLAMPDGRGGLTCYASTQAPFQVRAAVAAALGRDPASVRVVAPAVGGGFGAKGGAQPEQLVVAAVADRLGRPVRYVESRSENLVGMAHGRGQVQEVALGARRDGRLVGLSARTVLAVGAYPWRGGIPFATSRLMATGPYRVGRLCLSSQAVVTTTTPVGPYRGAGRPEAAAMLERAMDLLAVELGMDPATLRRMNLLRPDELPCTTPTGARYDGGDYGAALDAALALAGYDELRAEQDVRRRAGDPMALGIGMASFVEVSGTGAEHGTVRVREDGTAVLSTGASPHGQGHETTLAQVVADRLCMAIEDVEVVHSDTAAVARGTGTFGSRSGQLAGSAAARAAEAVVARARELVADLLEAAVEDVVLDGGGFAVAGVPARRRSWAEVAAEASRRGIELVASDDFEQVAGTYPFGTHVAVVEVDTATGKVALRRLVAVDDCGTVLNPLVVEGQVHGGLAQGVAQALYEEMAYDADGNPLTVTLADYAMPSAAELPSFELAATVTPTERNPLGAKGIGESGAVGSTAAVQNAVVDALAPYGVTHLDLPVTPQRVFEALAGR